jgi:RNA-directed DNA polymerase
MLKFFMPLLLVYNRAGYSRLLLCCKLWPLDGATSKGSAPTLNTTLISSRSICTAFTRERMICLFVSGVTAKSKEQIEALLPTIEEFLAERGLELNTERTKIVHVKDGFNFLGFNVRSYNGKCLVRPQKEKMQAFLKAIRAWLKTAKSIPPAAVISHLNPIIRGWSNYYKKVNSKKVLAYVEHQIWHAVYHWCLSCHPQKSKHWVLRRYFKFANGRTWTFFGTVLSQPDGGVKVIFLFRPSEVPVKPHVKVAGTASLDDSSLREYWSKRKSKLHYPPESLPDAYSV